MIDNKDIKIKVLEKIYENIGIENKRIYVHNELSNDKKDKYNHAKLAYTLWKDMDKDTARSYFSKMVRRKREFSDKDINTLYKIIKDR